MSNSTKRTLNMRAKLVTTIIGIGFALAAVTALGTAFGTGPGTGFQVALGWWSASLGWLSAFVMSFRNWRGDE